LPTPSIVIKGISDAADKNKSQKDAIGYWRDLAKENAVSLALELIRRGRIRPLQTDQFDIDDTIEDAGKARNIITEVSKPGVSYLLFPRLIVPRGPMTEALIKFEIFDENDHLEIIKMVLLYHDAGGNAKRYWRESLPFEFELHELIAPKPLGVCLLIRGKPFTIRIAVSSPTGTKKTVVELLNRR
jgi:hypothetical protein